MIEIREATGEDVGQLREVFVASYGADYAYSEYYDTQELMKLVYTDGTALLVAVDSESGRVAGTASVVFGIGAYNDLVGEFGRLAVHPDFRKRGIGKLLMQGRIDRVRERLHVGLVENRVVHPYSQKISAAHGFVPIGFIPMKTLLTRRESVALFVRHFGDALNLRRNNPRVIPEAGRIAQIALENCRLPADCILDDTSAPFPHDDDFEISELQTEGYSSLLRIERGRLHDRQIFGPVRLHYGLFQLKARHSHYLIARRGGQIAGGIGFMIDHTEKAVRIFELISQSDDPIRSLLNRLTDRCRDDWNVEYIEVDVSAHAPRMQRTLLELDFQPVGYTPGLVFHETERLDAVKMVRLLLPFELGAAHISESVQPFVDEVTRAFRAKQVRPFLTDSVTKARLFAGLNDEQRTRLVNCCSHHVYERDECIFEEGDETGTMHLILKGEVELTIREPAGSIGSLAAGQCLGETSLLHPPASAPKHSVTATARTRVETAAFLHADLIELTRRRPDIGVAIYRNLAAGLSAKLRDADRRLV